MMKNKIGPGQGVDEIVLRMSLRQTSDALQKNI